MELVPVEVNPLDSGQCDFLLSSEMALSPPLGSLRFVYFNLFVWPCQRWSKVIMIGILILFLKLKFKFKT